MIRRVRPAVHPQMVQATLSRDRCFLLDRPGRQHSIAEPVPKALEPVRIGQWCAMAEVPSAPNVVLSPDRVRAPLPITAGAKAEAAGARRAHTWRYVTDEQQRAFGPPRQDRSEG